MENLQFIFAFPQYSQRVLENSWRFSCYSLIMEKIKENRWIRPLISSLFRSPILLPAGHHALIQLAILHVLQGVKLGPRVHFQYPWLPL